MRATLRSLMSTPWARTCSPRRLTDQCVIGSPTSLGLRHASASTRAASASERESADAPNVGHPRGLLRGLPRRRTASSNPKPCVNSRPGCAPRRSVPRHLPSAGEPGLARRYAFRFSQDGWHSPPPSAARPSAEVFPPADLYADELPTVLDQSPDQPYTAAKRPVKFVPCGTSAESTCATRGDRHGSRPLASELTV